MRLPMPAALCRAVVAALLTATATPSATATVLAYAPTHTDSRTAPLTTSLTTPLGTPCAVPADRDFPVTTRIHGGPDSYEAGGGFGTWYLDLTNTTDRSCANIHPVVVLADDERALEAAQPRLEFYDDTGPDARPHPVRLERTDADELVGAFTDESDGFPGFTVGPGKTLTVKVRLALASDAVPNKVTVNAAVVQRHDGDGDWVGQSNEYRFGIDTEPTTTGRSPRPDSPATPSAKPSAKPKDSAGPSAPATDRLPFAEQADELARTGLPAIAALAATALLLTIGGALLAARRRR